LEAGGTGQIKPESRDALEAVDFYGVYVGSRYFMIEAVYNP